MSFQVAAEAYDQFMGRFSVLLAPVFADFTGIRPPMRVADVGCGPGALTTELVERLGADAVSAVDPSETFVAAARERHPGVDVRNAGAERLPFGDAAFDGAVTQLVVHFMTNPVAGLREMARVTRPGGVVGACVWDHERGATGILWQASKALALQAPGDADRAGTQKGDLARLFREAGMAPDADTALTVSRHFDTFDDWWKPFTLGVGNAGAFVAGLDPATQGRLREACSRLLPTEDFVFSPRVWAVRATVP